MGITKYEGQPLPAGTIVCKESQMIAGICDQPVAVVSETGSTVRVRDLRSGDEWRCNKSNMAFICDTEEEGWLMQKASMALVEAEHIISRQLAADRAARKHLAIDAAMNGANVGIKPTRPNELAPNPRRVRRKRMNDA